MMDSKKLEYTQRRQFRDRSPRQRGDYEDRWRESQGYHSNIPRDSHYMYGGDTSADTDMTMGKRQYSDSPQMIYTIEPSSRSRCPRSPERRCSPPDKDIVFDTFRYKSAGSSSSQELKVSDKRQRLTGNIEDHFKYRQLHDVRSWSPSKEDINYSKMSQDSKHRQTPEDYACRHPSEYGNDRRIQDRSMANSQETKQLTESSSRVFDETQDHWQASPRFPGNYTSLQAKHDMVNHSPALDKRGSEQTSRNEGFKRFLNVLNKGVDVNMLTKIVSQTPAVSDSRPGDSAYPIGSHRATGKQEKHHDMVYWNENNEPQQHDDEPRDFQGKSLSHDKSDSGGSHINSSNRMTSTQAMDKVKVKPEDEHKCKQMQHLLQAIGMDLGLEELGKMSNRIQQRLYGKREDSERRYSEKETGKETRQVFSPGCNSRSSSSSRSSFGPPTHQRSLKKDSIGSPTDVAEMAQAAGICSKASTQNHDNGNTAQESSVAPPSSTTYPLSEPPVTPRYPATPFSPHVYPPATYNYPPPWGVGAMPLPPYLPRYPPGYLPYPSVPSFPNYPPAPGQSNTFLQGTGNSHLGYFNLQDPNLVNSKQKMARPRCLQVIHTDTSSKMSTTSEIHKSL